MLVFVYLLVMMETIGLVGSTVSCGMASSSEDALWFSGLCGFSRSLSALSVGR